MLPLAPYKGVACAVIGEYSTAVLSLLQGALRRLLLERESLLARDTATTAKRAGTAAYKNGRVTVGRILDVARDLVITEGMAGLSMRRLARELEVSPGNLSYYYATKADLLADLVSHVLAPYLAEFERLRNLDSASPEAQLRAVLSFVFDDLGEQSTTHFFPELWVLALRDDVAARQMDALYQTYRSVLEEIIAQLRPDLPGQLVEDLALTISASIEGHTVFMGHARSHSARASHVKPLIIEQMINLAKTASG